MTTPADEAAATTASGSPAATGSPAASGSIGQKAPIEEAESAIDPEEGGGPPSARRLARLAAVLFFDGFRAAPGWMTGVTAMLVLGSVAVTCYPLGYKLLADGALAYGTRGGGVGELVEGVAVVAVLLGLAWVLLGIGATEAIALSDRIAIYRTRKLIELISGVPTLEHLERPDYLAKVEQLNAGRRQLASAPRLILNNVTSAVRIVVLLVLLGSVSPWLLFLPVVAAPPLICDRVAKRITKQSEDDMAAPRRLSGMIFDIAAGPWAAGELRCYGLAPRLKALHAELTGDLDRRATREAAKVLAVQAAGWLLYSAGLMGAIAFVAVRASSGAISLGTVLMTVSLIRRSRAQLSSAASGSSSTIAALATADRLLWLEDHHAAAVAAAGTAQAPDRLESAIVVRDLSFTYPGTERSVLSGLNFTVPAGATVAVVGENGSGKTTLVKLLLGMYQPTSGSIEVDGVPLSSIDVASWRSRCTAAFQDFAKFSLPAVESVGVAELESLDDEPLALAALDRAGASGLDAQLPEGLSTYVGGPYTGGHNLSGGQWQKLALGRAMRAPDPLLVVLDEPTASLDANAEQALFDRYTAAAQEYAERSGTVTLLVSHRFATVKTADLIVYLEAGHAVETGTHEQLLARADRYAELFTLQASGYR
jgi:ATP-binding cassette, subfamily B, bacterial